MGLGFLIINSEYNLNIKLNPNIIYYVYKEYLYNSGIVYTFQYKSKLFQKNFGLNMKYCYDYFNFLRMPL